MAKDCKVELMKKVEGLDEATAEKLLANIEDVARRRHRDGRSSSTTAYADAVKELIQNEKLVASHNDKVRLISHIKRQRAIERIDQFYDKGELMRGIQTLFENVAGREDDIGLNVDTLSKDFDNGWTNKLRALLERDEVLDLYRSGDIDLEIRRELYNLDSPKPGPVKHAQAAKIAKHIRDVGEEIRAALNERGALIGKLDGYTHNQKWDLGALRRGGRSYKGEKLSESDAREKFVAFAMDKVDTGRTLKDGTSLEDFLRGYYDNYMSNLHGKVEVDIGTQPKRGALAKRLGAERVLHLKNADAAAAFAAEYGEPKLMNGIQTQYQSLARSAALMEVLGPNPDQVVNDIVAHYRQKLKADSRLEEARRLGPGEPDYASVRYMFEFANGSALIPERVGLANFGAVGKAIVRMAKLGGAAITSISDFMFANNALANRGVSAWEALGIQAAAWADQMTSAGARAAVKSVGVALESFNGHAQMRFDSGLTARGAVAWMERNFFKMTLLPAFTDASKSAAVNGYAVMIGEFAAKAMDDLDPDFRSALARFDIGEAEWNFLRKRAGDISDESFIDKAALEWVQDHKAILPDQINTDDGTLVKLYGFKDTPENRKRAAQRVRRKLSSLYTEFSDIAVPTPGNREQRILRFRTQPGTAMGVFVDFLTMLKSFPLTVMNKPLAENYRLRGGDQGMLNFLSGVSGPLAIIRLAVLTSIMGYSATVIKDRLKGKSRRKFFDEEGNVRYSTFIDALQKGGSGGVIGDFMLSEYDRSYRSFSQSLLGPVVGQVDPLADIATRALKGEEFGPQSRRLVLDNFPGASLFYIRPAIEKLYWHEYLDATNPMWRRQMEDRMMERSGQEPVPVLPFFGQ